MLTILHSSDWHLGCKLYKQDRYAECEAYLQHLLLELDKQQVDILLIAGDIFDSNAPSNASSELYYKFLASCAQSCVRHIVVIAGNHDSPSYINAPKSILSALNVHVVGHMTEKPEDELITLYHEGKAEAIIAAIPYLRERDLRQMLAEEESDARRQKYSLALQEHYKLIGELALKQQERLRSDDQGEIPIIGMGHLFAAGGQYLPGDGVRELIIGNLLQIGVGSFPTCMSYVALGHLHVPQLVGGQENIRYSGSPLPMSFGEAPQQKEHILIQYEEGKLQRIQALTIPRFQELQSIKGDFEYITAKLTELKDKPKPIWLEIDYQSSTPAPQLRTQLFELVEGSPHRILCIKNEQARQHYLQARNAKGESKQLEELDPGSVFNSLLKDGKIEEDIAIELRADYSELLQSIQESDPCN